MPKTTLATFATFLVLISIIYYQAPDLIEEYSKQTHDIPQCIDRASIIKRGEQWVRMHIPFNSGATYDGYRQDGAGFLCMAWNAARPGVPIGYIGALSIRISKQDLQPGDAMYCQTKHVAIFTEWGAADQSQYIGMQLSNSTGLGTIKRYIPYPYFDSDKCFHPIKCSNIC